MAEYNRRKSEQEAKERHTTRRTHNSLYTKIQELAEELEGVSHSNEEQERLREILRLIALRICGGRTNSKQPARSVSQKQDN
jgi:hypothetical protein